MSDVEINFTDTFILVGDDGRKYTVRFTSMSSYPIGKMGTKLKATCEGYENSDSLAKDCDLGL
jgi:hypothetical protein